MLLWLSGAAMQAWLRATVRPTVAFVASLAYMSAPFHLTDHYWRGAFAEFSFFAVMPLLALSIRAAAREWRGVAGVALSYALPSGVTAVPIARAALVLSNGVTHSYNFDQRSVSISVNGKQIC